MAKIRKTPGKLINESWEYRKNVAEDLLKTTVHTTAATYKALDAWDKLIGKIWKPSENKVIDYIRNNLLKILIVWSIIGYTWVKTYQSFDKDKKGEKTEEVETFSWTKQMKFETNQKNAYRNNDDFFDKKFYKDGNTIDTLDANVYTSYDGGWYFYLMLPEDVKKDRVTTINDLRKKLSKYEKFKYLSSSDYEPQHNEEEDTWAFTNTFNLRDDYEWLAKNSSFESKNNRFRIPIPLKKEVRKISNKEFNTASNNAIQLLPMYNTTYGDIINRLSKKIDNKKLGELLTIIALLETWKTNTTIWSDEYHRREKWSYKCFSFWPQHVLMDGPWLVARKQLQLTECQTYNPTNSNALVLWFMIEKIIETFYLPEDRPELSKLTDTRKQQIADRLYKHLAFLNSEEFTTDNVADFCKFYNWGDYKKNNYDKKLIQAFTYLKKSLEKPNIDPKTYYLNNGGFTFYKMRTDEKWDTNYVSYKYIIQEGWTPWAVIWHFKETYDDFSDKEMTITNDTLQPYLKTKKFQKWDIVYVNVAL